MTPLSFWLHVLAFWTAVLEPQRSASAGVTDIREGHAIRARRHWQRVGRL